jgi:hypothetical protein
LRLAAHPTLKRGANERCASGADFSARLMEKSNRGFVGRLGMAGAEQAAENGARGTARPAKVLKSRTLSGARTKRNRSHSWRVAPPKAMKMTPAFVRASLKRSKGNCGSLGSLKKTRELSG